MTTRGEPRLAHGVTVAGTEVRFGIRGDGPRDLVLLHGSGANHMWWHAVAPQLERSWRVISVDFSGHGDSGHRATYDAQTWADELLAVIGAAGAAAPVVGAHSLGGRVALVAAAGAPSAFAGLVLFDTGIWAPEGLRERLAGLAARTGPPRVYPTREDALARFVLMPPQPAAAAELLGPVAEYSLRPVEGGWSWKHAGQAFPHLYEDVVAQAAADVTVPVAYVSGEASSVVTEELAQRAAETFAGPVMVRLPGAHHHLPLEVPQECARLIDELGGGMR